MNNLLPLMQTITMAQNTQATNTGESEGFDFGQLLGDFTDANLADSDSDTQVDLEGSFDLQQFLDMGNPQTELANNGLSFAADGNPLPQDIQININTDETIDTQAFESVTIPLDQENDFIADGMTDTDQDDPSQTILGFDVNIATSNNDANTQTVDNPTVNTDDITNSHKRDLGMPTEFQAQNHTKELQHTEKHAEATILNADADTKEQHTLYKQLLLQQQDSQHEQSQEQDIDMASSVQLKQMETPSTHLFNNDLKMMMDHIQPRASQQVNHAAPAQTVQTEVTESLHTENWDNKMAERVHWLVHQKVSSAEIHIHPRELGPVNAKIQIVEGKADITLSSQHGNVREALEAAMPKLRDMFQDSGIELNQVNVNSQAHSQEQRQPQTQQQRENLATHSQLVDAEDSAKEIITSINTLTPDGFVDYYA